MCCPRGWVVQVGGVEGEGEADRSGHVGVIFAERRGVHGEGRGHDCAGEKRDHDCVGAKVGWKLAC